MTTNDNYFYFEMEERLPFSVTISNRPSLLWVCLSSTMEALCVGCCLTEYKVIAKFLQKNISTAFLQEHGVLPSSVTCPNCNTPCTLRNDKPLWQCNTRIKVPKPKKKRDNFSTSDYKCSFADHCHLPIWKFIFVYKCLAEQKT